MPSSILKIVGNSIPSKDDVEESKSEPSFEGSVEETTEDNPKDKMWEEIGFHRQLAGFWYKIVFSLLHIVIGASVGVMLYPIMFPYPECDGYYRTATNVFVAIFVAFDLGTSNLMNRFVGANTNNPQKMIQYLQYFVWYQMFTGIIQVTGISIWAIYAPPQDLMYFMWIFILYSLTQYPAMQNVFKNALNALQQFNKSTIISFIQGDVVQKFLEVGFAIAFRYTLGQNPQYKVLLAVSIGLVFGKYLDDFIIMFLSAYFFSQHMSKYNIKVVDVFRHDFDMKLVKETFTYGVKTGFPAMINSFMGLVILAWWLTVPQYTTFVALYALAQSLVNFIKGLQLDLGGGIAESYMNGKKELCRYYIAQKIRYDAFMQVLLYSIFFVVTLILSDFFVELGMNNYILAVPFILTTLLRRFFMPYEQLPGRIMTSTNHPNFNFIVSTIQMLINVLMWYLFLVVFRIPHNYGINALVWLMPCGDLVSVLIVMPIAYYYVNKEIIRIKVPWWQSFVATSISGLIVYGYGVLLYNIIYIPIVDTTGSVISAIFPLVVLFLITVPFVFWVPLTVFFGGWDNNSVEVFEKSVKMAGLAKVFTIPMLKGMKWAVKRAKLHGKFSFDSELAEQEAKELMLMKEQGIDTKNF